MKGIELITRDDGQHFIEVEDYSWETDQIGFYHIEISNDPAEAKKFWLDFNNQNFNKNCCCTINENYDISS